MILPTFAAALEALIVQLAPLQSDADLRLDSTMAAPFIDVVKLSNEPTAPERVGRPYIVLSGTDEDAPEWGFTARKATILATCAASEFAGGLESATREPLPETMAQKLTALIQTNYATIRDAGLMGNRARRVREGVSSSADGPDIHFVDVEITFIFLTE